MTSSLSKTALLFQSCVHAHSSISADVTLQEGFPGQMCAPLATQTVGSALPFSNPERTDFVNLSYKCSVNNGETSNVLKPVLIKKTFKGPSLKQHIPPNFIHIIKTFSSFKSIL